MFEVIILLAFAFVSACVILEEEGTIAIAVTIRRTSKKTLGVYTTRVNNTVCGSAFQLTRGLTVVADVSPR